MTDPLRNRAITLVLLCSVFSLAAHAHSIDLFAHALGDEIHGSVSYGDGSPVVDTPVEISWDAPETAHDGEDHAATVQTDNAGKFVFKPTAQGEHLFICRTPDGHRAAFSMVYGTGAQDREPGSIDDKIEASVERHIGALQEQLHGYERQTRLRDVLGGIGYILGLAGLIALVKTRGRAT